MATGAFAAVVVLACGGPSAVLDRAPPGGLAASPEPPVPPLPLAERVPLPVAPEACRGPLRVAFMAADGSALHVVWSTAVGTTCWARLDATHRWRGARALAFETVAFGIVGGRHEHLGAICPRSTQQVGSRRVAVIERAAETP